MNPSDQAQELLRFHEHHAQALRLSLVGESAPSQEKLIEEAAKACAKDFLHGSPRPAVASQRVDTKLKAAIFALAYAELPLEVISRIGHLAQGGEQTGNWIHVVEAHKIIVRTLKEITNPQPESEVKPCATTKDLVVDAATDTQTRTASSTQAVASNAAPDVPSEGVPPAVFGGHGTLIHERKPGPLTNAELLELKSRATPPPVEPAASETPRVWSFVGGPNFVEETAYRDLERRLHAAEAERDESTSVHWRELKQERDAALARVAKLEGALKQIRSNQADLEQLGSYVDRIAEAALQP